jgi:hypothetical protein
MTVNAHRGLQGVAPETLRERERERMGEREGMRERDIYVIEVGR